MAEEDRAGITPRTGTSVSRLSKALSHTHLNLLEQEPMVASPMQPPALPPRLPGPPSARKRKLSKSQSLSGSQESLNGIVSEARVLVVNTGGTIGMMYQNEGERALSAGGSGDQPVAGQLMEDYKPQHALLVCMQISISSA